MIRAIFLVVNFYLVFGNSIHVSPKVLVTTGPSDNPIGITPPNFAGGEIANNNPPGSFFQDFKPPFPTNAWWSGLTVGTQSGNIGGPFPFQSKTTNNGLAFGIGDVRGVEGRSLKVHTQYDWTAGFDDLPDDMTHRKAVSWDTQTVCLQYFNDDEATMDSCLVPGSPYMTFTFNNAAVNLSSTKGNIVSFEWVTPGSKAKVVNGGGTYLIYALTPIELTADQKTLTSLPGFSGTLRMAKLYEGSQESILDSHANTYPTGQSMTYEISEDVATQTWTWNVVGDPADLLLLCWPHHRKVLQNPKNVGIDYLTLKGHMKGVAGNQWTLKHDLPTISWFAKNNPQTSCLAELNKTLEAEVNLLKVHAPGDFYYWGGAFGRDSRLALIAESIGRTDLTEIVLSFLKQSIEYWYDPNHTTTAAFETQWGGLINKKGWNNSFVDFGNAFFNDHHFHYGYLLHGAAVIGKYDEVWLADHLDFLTHVARDIGNPSPNDPHYTVTRHMDWFAGHSWASGVANSAGSRDQESTTEAINGYYGLLLFAHASKNNELIDYARLLLAIEISGAQMYWHLHPSNDDPDTPYPEQELRDFVTIGNVKDNEAGAWLFWGDKKTQIAGIQILPLTPIGQYTYDESWMQNVVPYCQAELDDVEIGDSLKSVIYAAYSKVNPQDAYMRSQQLFDWGTGNSASNQLYFVSTQTSASDICNSVTQTPEGVYNIQDVVTGLFVTVASNNHLAASAAVDALATKFKLSFIPGGGVLQSLSNDKFVTANPNGQSALAASRETQGSYEVFRWSRQDDDTFELTAMVNRAKIATDSDGQLYNNVNSTSGTPSRFRLVETQITGPVVLPEAGVLKNVETGKFVVSTSSDPVLRAMADDVSEGVQWNFEMHPDSTESSPIWALRSQVTNKVVTGNQAGTLPLTASRDDPKSWESFRFVAYQDAYIILHVSSGLAVGVQSDETLLDNNHSIDKTTLWTIE